MKTLQLGATCLLAVCLIAMPALADDDADKASYDNNFLPE